MYAMIDMMRRATSGFGTLGPACGRGVATVQNPSHRSGTVGLLTQPTPFRLRKSERMSTCPQSARNLRAPN